MITVPTWVRRLALAAVAGALVFGAALLPGDPGPAGRLAELTGAAGSPWAAVLLAIATGWAVWRLPAVGPHAEPFGGRAQRFAIVTRRALRRLLAVGPLTAVAIAAPFLDATGASACLAVASFAATGWLRRPGAQATYLLVSALWAVAPAAFGLAMQDAGSDAALQGSEPGSVLYGADLVAALQAALGSALLFAWLPFALGLWLRARREALAGAREHAERLEREQQVAAERAGARERARVAHDMHDVVAHRVSLMVLHAGALEVNAADPETVETAGLIRSTGVEALEQLREVLGLLRAEPAPAASGELERLVADSIRAGVPVSLRCNGSLDDLPTPLARTVYRTAREALTNVHKHAGAAPTAVEVDCTPDLVTLRVRNEPPPQPVRTLPGAGAGLAAVSEAVSVLGGTMTAEARPDGGFELAVALPRTVAAADRWRA